MKFPDQKRNHLEQPFSEAEIREAHLRGRSLNQVEIDRLMSLGVDVTAIASPWAVAVDIVQFRDTHFEFARDCDRTVGQLVFTIGVLGQTGLVDVAAWDPLTDRLASWLGRGFALGEGQLERARQAQFPYLFGSRHSIGSGLFALASSFFVRRTLASDLPAFVT